MIPIPRGLVVSCQGPPGTRLDNPVVMTAIAAAADRAGAIGIRAEGLADIRAIRDVTALPIIGLLKRDIDGARWVTPTVADALAVAYAGADMVAVDLTARARPDGTTADDMLRELMETVPVHVVADISTVEEGVAAARGGAAAVLSTMSGYTPHSRQLAGPDLALVSELAAAVNVPVIAEGRYRTTDEVTQALQRGAHAVVVGTAITNPLEITRWFVDAITESDALAGTRPIQPSDTKGNQ